MIFDIYRKFSSPRSTYIMDMEKKIVEESCCYKSRIRIINLEKNENRL